MTDVYRREVVKRTVEWVVPTREPWGACWTDVMLAIQQATNELWDALIVPRGMEPASDLIRIHPGDEDVVVAIELPAVATTDAPPSPSLERNTQ